jgi:hypothetical protein
LLNGDYHPTLEAPGTIAIPAIVGAVFTAFGAAAWFLIPKMAK